MNRPISRPAEAAVTIRNGYKTFKASGSKGTKVLQNFSMTVTAGTLYSLIGSSGCGKTTVLSCIVGVRKLDYGRLSVFGSKTVPVSPNRWQRIGFMPQEISLYADFSILETLVYFGTLFDTGRESTTRGYLMGRIDFLSELLSLPNIERIVGTLSGGQRRRVSFAVALIHEPELLLLDEPTSGVDPLIRECIWDHLNFLCAKKGTTIVLTTHYVDEAKDSDMVGIMRDGRLLAEENPKTLMNAFQTSSLETAFLELCKQQESSGNNSPSSTALKSAFLNGSIPLQNRPSIQRRRSHFPVTKRVHDSSRRIGALVEKNYKNMFRNIWMLIFITVIPGFCIYISCVTFQQDPYDISMGVVNHDVTEYEQCFSNYSTDESCQFDHLSCSYLREIPPETFKLRPFDSISQARKAIEKGLTWGYISFPMNYTKAVMNRAFNGHDEIAEDDVEGLRLWNSSKITVSLDQTNMLMRVKILMTLYETFEKTTKAVLRDCGFDERNGQFPLQYGEPIMGDNDPTFLTYITPGLAICALWIFPLTVAVRYITEKRQGTLERCLAAGTQVWEVLVAQGMLETVVLLIQSTLSFCILHYGYDIGPSPIEDPITVMFILAMCILIGLSSVSCGFLMGVVCDEEVQAAMATMAIVIPCVFLSGSFWPLEGMPEVMKILSPLLPMTLPGETLRSLMVRRLDIYHPRVWPGFMVTGVYILGGSLITIWVINRQTRNK